VVSDVSLKLRSGSGLPGPTILVFNTIGSILLFATVYRYAPLGRLHWISALKGAVPAGIAIQLVPAIVGVYVNAAAGFAAVQLFLLIAIVLLGLYIVALAMLVGAGIAATIERELPASPD
jgi:uncharacterized BrkB/YihY/UPF0761 family membrane protein